jgi:hypothetical protein
LRGEEKTAVGIEKIPTAAEWEEGGSRGAGYRTSNKSRGKSDYRKIKSQIKSIAVVDVDQGVETGGNISTAGSENSTKSRDLSM